MKDITALEAKYKELGAEIDALKSAKVKEWPQINDQYFTLLNDGKIFTAHIRNVDLITNGCKAIGNLFRTMAEATKELETRKTIAELRAQPGRKKFVDGEINYCVWVKLHGNLCIVDSYIGSDMGFASTYFESAEAAESAIKAVGAERILAASKWLSMGE